MGNPIERRGNGLQTIYLNRDNLADWQGIAKPCVVALGFFDGIHLGHREVIKTAAQMAKRKNLSLAVMSFFPHPKTVISNGKKQVSYLMPLSKKEECFRKLGVDIFYIVEFNKGFSSLSPVEFVSQYLLNLGVVHVVAGFDYSYGHKGTGNMDRLRSDSNGRLDVTKVEKMEFQGEKISSSCIREKLLSGNIEELLFLLGSPYEVDGEWDGERLTIKPYYTLPAPGPYVVTLKHKSGSIQTEVSVFEENHGRSVRLMKRISKHMAGNLSIVWHNRIQEESFIEVAASSVGFRS
jgi:cytidyltransferase-like protein